MSNKRTSINAMIATIEIGKRIRAASSHFLRHCSCLVLMVKATHVLLKVLVPFPKSSSAVVWSPTLIFVLGTRTVMLDPGTGSSPRTIVWLPPPSGSGISICIPGSAPSGTWYCSVTKSEESIRSRFDSSKKTSSIVAKPTEKSSIPRAFFLNSRAEKKGINLGSSSTKGTLKKMAFSNLLMTSIPSSCSEKN